MKLGSNIAFVLLFLVTALGFFAPSVARSEVIASLGTNLIYELDNDGRSFEARHPFSVRGGYRFSKLDAFVEYSTFRTSGGTQMIQVARTNHEISAWLRHVIRGKWPLAPFLAAGLGANYQVIDTTLAMETRTDAGRPELLSGLVMGVEASLASQLKLQIEGRLASAASYAPNPLFGFGIHALLEF